MTRPLMEAISDILGKHLEAQRELVSQEISLKLNLQKRENFADYLSEIAAMQSAMLSTSVATSTALSRGMRELIDAIGSNSDISEAAKEQLLSKVGSVFQGLIADVGNEFEGSLRKQAIKEALHDSTK